MISSASTETTLPTGTIKKDFDKDSVLERFNYQLKNSGINTVHTMKPDFTWCSSDLSEIKKYFQLEKYIILFPFCPGTTRKLWGQGGNYNLPTFTEIVYHLFFLH